MKVISHQRFSMPMIRFFIFFLLFYLYVLSHIDPRLIYHGHGIIPFPIFFRGVEFFKGFLVYPGGLIEYISAFLSQFYYFHYFGSFIITIVIVLISLMTGKFITSFGGTRFRSIIYVPALFLLIEYNRYFHCLDAMLVLLVSLFFLWIYLLIAHRRIIFRITIFLISSFILYYIAGGISLLYALLCGIFEFLIKRNYLICLFYIFLALLIPYTAYMYVFEISITDAYTRVLPIHPESYLRESNIIWFLYIFFPLSALWLQFWRLFVKKQSRRKSSKIPLRYEADRTSFGKNFPNYSKISKLKFLYESLFLLFVAAGVVFFSFNKNENIKLRINYFSSQEMWNHVLKEAQRLPDESYNLLVTHDVNKALYYTGRLPYDMFSYPQDVRALLTLSFFSPSSEATFLFADLPRISDTFFRLGFINHAEHAAYEAMEIIGEYPAILQQLFLINIVKRKPETAKIFLNALSKDLIFSNRAKRYLRHLDEDPFMSTDKQVQHIRSVMLVTDYDKDLDLGIMLQSLQYNKQNQMAFEYMMAYYLLSYRLDKIVQNIHRLNDFNYPDIPRHYEEAVLIYMDITGRKVDLHGRKINTNTVRKFQRFCDIVDRYNNNRNAGLAAVTKEFGDSYFSYIYLFLVSKESK